MNRLKILKGFMIWLGLVVIIVGTFATIVSAEGTTSLIIKLAAGLSQEEQAAVIGRCGGVELSSVTALRLHTIEVPTTDLNAVLLNYRSDPQVERVEINQTRKVEGLPADPLYPGQWALPRIGWDSVFGSFLPFGWATVAILDTGVDPLHPDLAGNILAGTSIINGSGGTVDPNGHGTALAGIVAALSNDLGVAGVGFSGVKIMPVTVLGADGTGQDSDIISGIIWAVDNGANVILMGFSNPGFSQNLQDAIDYAWSKDVVLVAAVGNDASTDPTYPAGDRGVIGVSSTDSDDALSSFSNYGSDTTNDVFIAAPGENILTTGLDYVTYPSITGTSASAAIVAGVAAFMRASDPLLSNGVVVGRLARTADPAGTQYQTGNGRVNMARAVSDTSTDPIEPTGAPGGGPYVGPYTIATLKLNVQRVGAASITVNSGASFNPQFRVENNNNGSDSSRTFSGSWSVNTTGSISCAPTSGNFSALASGSSVTINLNCTAPTGPASGTVTVSASGNPSAGSNVCGSGGNTCSSSENLAVTINAPTDTTPPVITPNISGTSGTNGWYTSDVTVSWTVTDPDSSITSSTGCGQTTITTDTAGTALTCSATSAGGTSSQSVTIKCDKTPPSATLSVTSGTPGNNGWYTSDVTVHTSGTDTISGPVTCTADQFQTTETAGTNFNGSCTNDAGLSTNAATLTVKLDKTGPTAALSVKTGTPGNNGWYISNVTVQTTGTDSISSPVTCTADQFQTTETAGAVFSGSCTNDAGLKTDATQLTIKLDKTPPTGVSGAPNRAADHNGWYNHAVDVVFTGSDSLSGIDSCTTANYSGPDSAAVSVNGTCTDQAGNTSSPVASSAFKYDATAPAVALSAARTADNNGWYNHAVSFTVKGDDITSGIASCDQPVDYTGPDSASASVSGSCTDEAGNTGTGSANFKYDATAPSVTLSADRAADHDGWYNHAVSFAVTGDDITSGIASCDQPVDYTGPDSASVSVSGSCTDEAGNTGTGSANFKYDATPPAVSNVLADPVAVGQQMTITATIGDSSDGGSNIESAEFRINDGAVDVLTGLMEAGDGSFDEPMEDVTAAVASPAVGVYNVCVHGTDGADNIGSEECTFLAVYDPSAGFVTGGGWINSPSGAYADDPSLTGKATFGFVSKYQKGTNVPTGNTEFQFKTGSLNFHSDIYEWLVVSGARAQYKGTGTINGTGNYGFLLTAIDGQVKGGGGVDKFRIKIWDNDEGGIIVYDNKMGSSDVGNDATELGGGSIVIHK